MVSLRTSFSICDTNELTNWNCKTKMSLYKTQEEHWLYIVKHSSVIGTIIIVTTPVKKVKISFFPATYLYRFCGYLHFSFILKKH